MTADFASCTSEDPEYSVKAWLKCDACLQPKGGSRKGSGLKDLLQAAADGQRHFSIKFDARFEVRKLAARWQHWQRCTSVHAPTLGSLAREKTSSMSRVEV